MADTGSPGMVLFAYISFALGGVLVVGGCIYMIIWAFCNKCLPCGRKSGDKGDGQQVGHAKYMDKNLSGRGNASTQDGDTESLNYEGHTFLTRDALNGQGKDHKETQAQVEAQRKSNGAVVSVHEESEVGMVRRESSKKKDDKKRRGMVIGAGAAATATAVVAGATTIIISEHNDGVDEGRHDVVGDETNTMRTDNAGGLQDDQPDSDSHTNLVQNEHTNTFMSAAVVDESMGDGYSGINEPTTSGHYIDDNLGREEYREQSSFHQEELRVEEHIESVEAASTERVQAFTNDYQQQGSRVSVMGGQEQEDWKSQGMEYGEDTFKLDHDNQDRNEFGNNAGIEQDQTSMLHESFGVEEVSYQQESIVDSGRRGSIDELVRHNSQEKPTVSDFTDSVQKDYEIDDEVKYNGEHLTEMPHSTNSGVSLIDREDSFHLQESNPIDFSNPDLQDEVMNNDERLLQQLQDIDKQDSVNPAGQGLAMMQTNFGEGNEIDSTEVVNERPIYSDTDERESDDGRGLSMMAVGVPGASLAGDKILRKKKKRSSLFSKERKGEDKEAVEMKGLEPQGIDSPDENDDGEGGKRKSKKEKEKEEKMRKREKQKEEELQRKMEKEKEKERKKQMEREKRESKKVSKKEKVKEDSHNIIATAVPLVATSRDNEEDMVVERENLTEERKDASHLAEEESQRFSQEGHVVEAAAIPILETSRDSQKEEKTKKEKERESKKEKERQKRENELQMKRDKEEEKLRKKQQEQEEKERKKMSKKKKEVKEFEEEQQSDGQQVRVSDVALVAASNVERTETHQTVDERSQETENDVEDIGKSKKQKEKEEKEKKKELERQERESKKERERQQKEEELHRKREKEEEKLRKKQQEKEERTSKKKSKIEKGEEEEIQDERDHEVTAAAVPIVAAVKESKKDKKGKKEKKSKKDKSHKDGEETMSDAENIETTRGEEESHNKDRLVTMAAAPIVQAASYSEQEEETGREDEKGAKERKKEKEQEEKERKKELERQERESKKERERQQKEEELQRKREKEEEKLRKKQQEKEERANKKKSKIEKDEVEEIQDEQDHEVAAAAVPIVAAVKESKKDKKSKKEKKSKKDKTHKDGEETMSDVENIETTQENEESHNKDCLVTMAAAPIVQAASYSEQEEETSREDEKGAKERKKEKEKEEKERKKELERQERESKKERERQQKEEELQRKREKEEREHQRKEEELQRKREKEEEKLRKKQQEKEERASKKKKTIEKEGVEEIQEEQQSDGQQVRVSDVALVAASNVERTETHQTLDERSQETEDDVENIGKSKKQKEKEEKEKKKELERQERESKKERERQQKEEELQRKREKEEEKLRKKQQEKEERASKKKSKIEKGEEEEIQDERDREVTAAAIPIVAAVNESKKDKKSKKEKKSKKDKTQKVGEETMSDVENIETTQENEESHNKDHLVTVAAAPIVQASSYSEQEEERSREDEKGGKERKKEKEKEEKERKKELERQERESKKERERQQKEEELQRKREKEEREHQRKEEELQRKREKEERERQQKEEELQRKREKEERERQQKEEELQRKREKEEERLRKKQKEQEERESKKMKKKQKEVMETEEEEPRSDGEEQTVGYGGALFAGGKDSKKDKKSKKKEKNSKKKKKEDVDSGKEEEQMEGMAGKGENDFPEEGRQLNGDDYLVESTAIPLVAASNESEKKNKKDKRKSKNKEEERVEEMENERNSFREDQEVENDLLREGSDSKKEKKKSWFGFRKSKRSSGTEEDSSNMLYAAAPIAGTAAVGAVTAAVVTATSDRTSESQEHIVTTTDNQEDEHFSSNLLTSEHATVVNKNLLPAEGDSDSLLIADSPGPRARSSPILYEEDEYQDSSFGATGGMAIKKEIATRDDEGYQTHDPDGDSSTRDIQFDRDSSGEQRPLIEHDNFEDTRPQHMEEQRKSGLDMDQIHDNQGYGYSHNDEMRENANFEDTHHERQSYTESTDLHREKEVSSYHDNGEIEREHVTSYHDNGEIEREHVTSYHDNGEIVREHVTSYHDNGEIERGHVTSYHDNGEIEREHVTSYHENGEIERGHVTSYHDNGEIEREDVTDVRASASGPSDWEEATGSQLSTGRTEQTSVNSGHSQTWDSQSVQKETAGSVMAVGPSFTDELQASARQNSDDDEERPVGLSILADIRQKRNLKSPVRADSVDSGDNKDGTLFDELHTVLRSKKKEDRASAEIAYDVDDTRYTGNTKLANEHLTEEYDISKFNVRARASLFEKITETTGEKVIPSYGGVTVTQSYIRPLSPTVMRLAEGASVKSSLSDTTTEHRDIVTDAESDQVEYHYKPSRDSLATTDRMTPTQDEQSEYQRKPARDSLVSRDLQSYHTDEHGQQDEQVDESLTNGHFETFDRNEDSFDEPVDAIKPSVVETKVERLVSSYGVGYGDTMDEEADSVHQPQVPHTSTQYLTNGHPETNGYSESLIDNDDGHHSFSEELTDTQDLDKSITNIKVKELNRMAVHDNFNSEVDASMVF